MSLEPEPNVGGKRPTKPAEGLRLGAMIGVGGGVVCAVALLLVVFIAGRVTDWVDDQSLASALVAVAVWAVVLFFVALIVGVPVGGAVGLVLGAARWEAAAPWAGLVLAPLVLCGFTAFLAAAEQFGDIGSGERVGFFIVVAAFAVIGYLAGRLFRDKLRAIA